VSLPFVLVSESAGAACEGEDADEGAGVGACGVAMECCCVSERGVIAGLAGKLALSFGDVFGIPRVFGGRR
jgi:hypothetical protein